jgi:predicted RNA-binding protein with PIN domain
MPASMGMAEQDPVRWLVDAMNVIGTRPDGWWKDRHAAIVRLVEHLERWVAATDADVTVVLEGPPSPPISSESIEIAHASRPEPNAADDEIVRRLREYPDPQQVRVVTSDRALAERARSLGAVVEPAASFRRRLEQT